MSVEFSYREAEGLEDGMDDEALVRSTKRIMARFAGTSVTRPNIEYPDDNDNDDDDDGLGGELAALIPHPSSGGGGEGLDEPSGDASDPRDVAVPTLANVA